MYYLSTRCSGLVARCALWSRCSSKLKRAGSSWALVSILNQVLVVQVKLSLFYRLLRSRCDSESQHVGFQVLNSFCRYGFPTFCINRTDIFHCLWYSSVLKLEQNYSSVCRTYFKMQQIFRWPPRMVPSECLLGAEHTQIIKLIGWQRGSLLCNEQTLKILRLFL